MLNDFPKVRPDINYAGAFEPSFTIVCLFSASSLPLRHESPSSPTRLSIIPVFDCSLTFYGLYINRRPFFTLARSNGNLPLSARQYLPAFRPSSLCYEFRHFLPEPFFISYFKLFPYNLRFPPKSRIALLLLLSSDRTLQTVTPQIKSLTILSFYVY